MPTGRRHPAFNEVIFIFDNNFRDTLEEDFDWESLLTLTLTRTTSTSVCTLSILTKARVETKKEELVPVATFSF